MKKEKNITVERIFSAEFAASMQGKSEIYSGLVLAAFEAQQRGEGHITVTIETDIRHETRQPTS